LKLDIVDETQVLAKVVFPVEGPLFQGPFCTARVIVGLGVVFWWIRQTTEHTSVVAIVGTILLRAIRAADPPLKRQMQ
jgi:hypothetical protein